MRAEVPGRGQSGMWWEQKPGLGTSGLRLGAWGEVSGRRTPGPMGRNPGRAESAASILGLAGTG